MVVLWQRKLRYVWWHGLHVYDLWWSHTVFVMCREELLWAAVIWSRMTLCEVERGQWSVDLFTWPSIAPVRSERGLVAFSNLLTQYRDGEIEYTLWSAMTFNMNWPKFERGQWSVDFLTWSIIALLRSRCGSATFSNLLTQYPDDEDILWSAMTFNMNWPKFERGQWSVVDLLTRPSRAVSTWSTALDCHHSMLCCLLAITQQCSTARLHGARAESKIQRFTKP